MKELLNNIGSFITENIYLIALIIMTVGFIILFIMHFIMLRKSKNIIKSISDKNTEMNTRLENLQKTNAKLVNSGVVLSKKNEKLENENKILNDALEKAHKSLKEEEDKNETLEASVFELTEKLNGTRGELNEYVEKYMDADSEAHSLKNELSAKDEVISKLNDEIKTLRKECALANAELVAAKDALTESVKENQSLKAKRVNLIKEPEEMTKAELLICLKNLTGSVSSRDSKKVLEEKLKKILKGE